MSRHARRMRRARSCCYCGWTARHYVMQREARHAVNPHVCQACATMPRSWRDELAREWRNKVEDREWRRARGYERDADRLPLVPATFDDYTSLGSYPIVHYDAGGETYCGDCMLQALRNGDIRNPHACMRDVYYEGPPETCCECRKEIESAYGDPDGEETSEERADDNGDPHEDLPGYGF